jgi:hypothetical protein
MTNLPVGLALAAVLAWLGRRDLDAEVPVAVRITARSKRLGALAQRCAAAGNTGPDAVAGLREAAGRHRIDLRRAAARTRLGGRAAEHRTAHLANQLLLAAATGRPVQPVSAEQEQWFRRVEDFLVHAEDEPFDQLVALRARLADVARTVEADRTAALTGPAAERAAALADTERRARAALDELVGPTAVGGDRLVRSHAARGVARSWLAGRLRGG